jgi:hypothetical protein
MSASQLLEKHLLDGHKLEWREIGMTAWHLATEHRAANIVDHMHGRAEHANFATGRAGSCLKYTYHRFRNECLQFKPVVKFDATGLKRRCIAVRAVGAGEMALTILGTVRNGMLVVDAFALSGRMVYTGRYSLAMTWTVKAIRTEIRFTLRARKD